MAPFVCACEARELPPAPLPASLCCSSRIFRRDQRITFVKEPCFPGLLADFEQLGRNVVDAMAALRGRHAPEEIRNAAISTPNSHQLCSSGRLRRLSPHFALLRVDAARPRLGRALRTAPVSRQTVNPKAVCHEPRFPSRPATLPRPPFCPLPRSALFFPAAAQVKKKTSRKRREREKQ